MGLTDLWSDFMAAVSLTELHAEAPQEDDKKEDEKEEESKDDGEEGDKDDSEGKEDDSGDAGEDGGDSEEDDGGEEEEEEEEEEEPEDPKPRLEQECARSAQCAPMKHHFDECVERVTAKEEDENYKGPKEDCVEEFFHLQHCAAQCAAPKLFKMLK